MTYRLTPPARRLVVVDPLLDDYRCLVEPARSEQLRLTLTTTGSNALRLAPSFADAVWLVNTRLPDMEGFDLVEMLHSLASQLRVAVIDDSYQPLREKRAIQLRAIQYVCKPVQFEWIWGWLTPATTNTSIDGVTGAPDQPHAHYPTHHTH